MFRCETQGAVEVVTPEVAINHENAPKLREAVLEKALTGQPMVVLNMCHVPLVDSVGLETLLDLQEELHASAGSMKMAGLTQLCKDIFRVTGLADRFETFADTKAAVGSFVR